YRAPDFSNITPEDQAALSNATMAVGGIVGGGTQGVLPGTPGARAGPWDLLRATPIRSLAGGIPTPAHHPPNAPVQAGLKLLSDVPASVLTGHAEAVPAELYGAVQGIRSWALHAATTLGEPGPLARQMGGGPGAQALETGLTGLVRTH